MKQRRTLEITSQSFDASTRFDIIKSDSQGTAFKEKIVQEANKNSSLFKMYRSKLLRI